jgi:hypothetical protein
MIVLLLIVIRADGLAAAEAAAADQGNNGRV